MIFNRVSLWFYSYLGFLHTPNAGSPHIFHHVKLSARTHYHNIFLLLQKLYKTVNLDRTACNLRHFGCSSLLLFCVWQWLPALRGTAELLASWGKEACLAPSPLYWVECRLEMEIWPGGQRSDSKHCWTTDPGCKWEVFMKSRKTGSSSFRKVLSCFRLTILFCKLKVSAFTWTWVCSPMGLFSFSEMLS